MKKIIYNLLFIVILSCSTVNESPELNSDDNWFLSKIDNQIISEFTQENKIITLKFDTIKKNISGKAPCNNYFGSYNLKVNQITFDKITSTKKACDLLALENKYFQMLSEVKSFTIENNKLNFLNNEDKIILEYKN